MSLDLEPSGRAASRCPQAGDTMSPALSCSHRPRRQCLRNRTDHDLVSTMSPVWFVNDVAGPYPSFSLMAATINERDTSFSLTAATVNERDASFSLIAATVNERDASFSLMAATINERDASFSLMAATINEKDAPLL